MAVVATRVAGVGAAGVSGEDGVDTRGFDGKVLFSQVHGLQCNSASIKLEKVVPHNVLVAVPKGVQVDLRVAVTLGRLQNVFPVSFHGAVVCDGALRHQQDQSERYLD